MNIFDKNLKKKLDNAELPVSDGIWENIEAQIPVKQDKPKYWMLFLVAMFALPFLIYQLTEIDKPTAEGIEKNTKELTVVENTIGEDLYSGSSINKRSKSTENLDESSSVDNGSATDGDPSNRFNENDPISTNSNSGLIASENAINTSVNSRYISGSDQTTLINNFDNIRLSGTISNLSPNQNLIAESATTSTRKKLKFLKRPFSDKIEIDNSGTNFKLIEKSRIFQKAERIKEIPLIAGSLLSNLGTLENDRLEAIDTRLLGLRKASPICPSFKPFSTGIYLFADVRSGLVNQQLENKTNNPEVDEIIRNRMESESGAISSSFNLGIGKKWDSGLLLESGLNLDIITTTLRFLKPGGTIIVIDSFPEIVMDTISTDPQMISSKNKFRQLNIPVNLGYEFRISERYSIAAKGGILINLSSSNSGQLLTETGLTSYDSSEIANSFFKTNLNLSYTGGLDLIGDINKLFSGYIGLNVNYYPDDFSLSTYLVRQSYYKYGVTAGLRYRI